MYYILTRPGENAQDFFSKQSYSKYWPGMDLLGETEGGRSLSPGIAHVLCDGTWGAAILRCDSYSHRCYINFIYEKVLK